MRARPSVRSHQSAHAFFVNNTALKPNYSSFLRGSEHMCSLVHGQQGKSILTRTTGQMYEGNRVWSLKAPPSHSGFTLDAHLLWSCRGEERQKHKNCGRNPSAALSASNDTRMKCFTFEAVNPDSIYQLFDGPHGIELKSYVLCASMQNIFHAEMRTNAL